MIPQLWNADTKGVPTYRRGALHQATSAIVRREINGEYSLTLTIPPKADHESECVEGRCIQCAVNEEGALQYFQIKKVSRTLGGQKTVYAEHQSYLYDGVPVAPFLNNGTDGGSEWAFEQAEQNAIGIPAGAVYFSYERDQDYAGSEHVLTPTLLRPYLLKLTETFGGEMLFDGFDVTWADRIGQDRGVRIKYSVNLIGLDIDSVPDNCYTAVYPFWGSAEGDYVELPEKTLSYNNNLPFSRTEIVDFISQIEDKPTVAQLRSAAQDYMLLHVMTAIPSSFAIRKVTRIGEQPLDLGDSVNVVFDDWNIDASFRVVSMEVDALKEKVTSIVVGAQRDTFAKTILNLTRR